jgi:hypothetical protein
LLGFGFLLEVLGDGDVDDAAGRDVWRQKNRREFDLDVREELGLANKLRSKAIRQEGAHEALVGSQQDGNARIDLTDGQRDEHIGEDASSWQREECASSLWYDVVLSGEAPNGGA